MQLNDATVGLAVSIGINFSLLYTRKSKWNTDIFRWLSTGILFLSGLIVFYTERSIDKDFGFLSWCVITPLIYNVVDRVLKLLSLRILKRDFFLWLRYSNEIDDSPGGKNPHIHWLDKVLSIALLAL